jgi:formate--tetrahydrofolate ligase
VVHIIETTPSRFKPLYPDDMPLWEKTKAIAKEIYRADDITADKAVRDRFAELEKAGFGKFPICVAKTQYSFSTNPDAKGAPTGFTIPIREVRLSAGAEFVVVICGDIMTMPGLPKVPAANNIELAQDGRITGLF